MIHRPILSIDELGQLAGLLSRYHKELIYDAQDGAALDEDEFTLNKRAIAIERVGLCLREITDDLYYRLHS